MDMLGEIAIFLIRNIGTLFLWAVLLRFLLQLARADFYNPISQALVRITNPVVKPLRRLVPGFFGIDVASLVLALVVKLITILAIVAISTGGLNIGLLLIVMWAVLGCLAVVLNIYFLAMIGTIIVSWVAAGSYHPAIVLINQLAEPVMAPFRRLLPPMGGIDFSPIIAFLALNVVKIVLSGMAMRVGLLPQSFLGLLTLGI